MGRLTDAILSGAYSNSIARPMLDVSKTGYQGYAPDLTNWVSNQAHLEGGQMICLLVEAPKMFTVLPNSPKWIASLKSLFETHARNIDGMNAGLKVDTDEHAVGGGGEMHQEFTNVTRERSQPKFQFIEKYGRPIQTLLDYWIRYGIMDPETKYALLGSMKKADVKDMLADWFTATCLFIVPDPLHKSVDKAWLTANMAPLGTGEITGKRDLTSAKSILTLDVEFSGISAVGFGVNSFAQNVLDRINTLNADPFNRPSFVNKIAADVEAANTTGYKQDVEQLGRTSITSIGG